MRSLTSRDINRGGLPPWSFSNPKGKREAPRHPRITNPVSKHENWTEVSTSDRRFCPGYDWRQHSQTYIRFSMDGKGAWRDNVFIERFWWSLKYEHVYLHAY